MHVAADTSDRDGPVPGSDPTGVVDLSFAVDADLLVLARLAVAHVASRSGFDIEEIEDLRLAVDELCLSVLAGRRDGRLLVRFDAGFGGTIEANWVKTGRKMQLAFEVEGSKGSLAFTQERLNELKFYKAGQNPQTSGFTTIESGPQHPPYGGFCVAAGHQLGFNDLKTIEMAEFLGAIGGAQHAGPDFREAFEIQKVVEAAIQSSKSGASRVAMSI